MSRHALANCFDYQLIAFDKDGRERLDDPASLMSDGLAEAVASGDYTDVFVASHGWKGDVPAAVDQYDRWFGALVALDADIAAARARRPSFKPLLIGLHWPSLPFGDEVLHAGSFAAAEIAEGGHTLVDRYAEILGDTPEIRACLAVIADAVDNDAGALRLPPQASAAFRDLDAALGLGSGDLAGPPDADRAAFDPDEALAAMRIASFGIRDLVTNLPLAILRQLSFWSMKKRGRDIGENAFHPLLARLMEAAAAPQEQLRFHLMGHSFGCVAMSSAICGPGGKGRLPHAVDSMFLVQGALSLWSYSPAIELADGRPGYYAGLPERVRGPVAVTRSVHDSAVGKLYPLASKLKGSVDFTPAKLPRFGGLGTFGAQGLAGPLLGPEVPIGPTTTTYALASGTLYNVNGDAVIAKGGGFGGAHNDIDGPEVAHLWWELARNAG